MALALPMLAEGVLRRAELKPRRHEENSEDELSEAILEDRNAEVEQEADLEPAQFQVRERLTAV